MAKITIRNLSKSFGPLKVLNNIDITVQDKEFVALVGPSGCGKSTLLRMIAGLETLSAGDIIVDETIVTNTPAQRRDLAMVFQSYALYPHLKTSENIGFPLKMRGLPKAEIAEKVENAAKILKLTDYLDRLPKHLSGGQRQRVAMGRAIVRSPKAFLFDEPLSNLDAKLRIHMRSEIRGLHDELGATSIYVTHDQVEAMTMADRIVVMHGGTVEQVGTPMELFDRPKNVFVAGFLGAPTMNFLTAVVSAKNDQQTVYKIAGTSSEFTTPIEGFPSVSLGDIVQIGLRPQHISTSHEAIENSIEATVKIAEQTGCETILVIQVEGGLELTLQTHERVLFASGDKIFVTLTPEHLHFFDQSGEHRLN